MSTLADQQQLQKLIDELAQQIAASLEKHGSPRPWAMIGMRSRGDQLAQRLAQILKPDHVGTLDITLYRDDLADKKDQPVVRTTEIPFSLDDLHVVLVDDVIMTGRSVRAALESLMDMGRPQRVWLSVLVDRGGRELPIAPDHVALDLSEGRVPAGKKVVVQMQPPDDADAIVLQAQESATKGSAA